MYYSLHICCRYLKIQIYLHLGDLIFFLGYCAAARHMILFKGKRPQKFLRLSNKTSLQILSIY